MPFIPPCRIASTVERPKSVWSSQDSYTKPPYNRARPTEAHLYARRNITAPENPVGRNLIDGNGRPEIHDQQIAARVERRSADGDRKTVLTQSFGRSVTVTNGKRKLR